MISPELPPSSPAVVRISELDFTLLTPTQAEQLLHATARRFGLEPEGALYTGFDALDFAMDGSFGTRVETWAFDVDQLRRSTEAAERYSEYDSRSPYYYARLTDPGGIAIFDQSKFDNLGFREEEGRLREPEEYRLKDGYAMDDAIVAVVIIES